MICPLFDESLACDSLASQDTFSYYDSWYGQILPITSFLAEGTRAIERLTETGFQHLYSSRKRIIERRLAAIAVSSQGPASVYEPIRYVLSTGGKRIRAVLVLLACEAAGGAMRQALDAAVAIELLHNFTLVHDDVMDHAGVRRGLPTVHRKWDENTAILAGDEMIAQAYRMILGLRSPRIVEMLAVCNDALVQVCEGQGFDKEFENRDDVRLKDYIRMIEKKTARIIAAALEIGALAANAKRYQLRAFRRFGEYLGRAFQVQDDLLDMVGTTQAFGKRIGGDIIEGKKTYLLVKALEEARGPDRALLEKITPQKRTTEHDIERIRMVYQRLGVFDAARAEIFRSTIRAQRALDALPPGRARSQLWWIAEQLQHRSS